MNPIISSDDTGESMNAAFVSAALAAEIAATFGPPQGAPLSVFARAEHADPVGGIVGAIHWNWLYIRHFWVAEDWRGRGLGRRLMAQAETGARARGCVGIYLDTFDPGAETFYASLGFARFGAIADFPPGHARRFLLKRLVREGGATAPAPPASDPAARD